MGDTNPPAYLAVVEAALSQEDRPDSWLHLMNPPNAAVRAKAVEWIFALEDGLLIDYIPQVPSRPSSATFCVLNIQLH